MRSIPQVQDIIKDRLGKNLTKKNIADIKTAIINSGITKSANMQNALAKYVDVMHSQYNILSLNKKECLPKELLIYLN